MKTLLLDTPLSPICTESKVTLKTISMFAHKVGIGVQSHCFHGATQTVCEIEPSEMLTLVT